MVLRLADKKKIVDQVAAVAAQASCGVAVEYRGVTGPQITQLRALARKEGVFLRVVPNTLASRAFLNTSFICMQEILAGPLILAFSTDSPGAAPRLMQGFLKENDHLKVKGIAINGRLFGADHLNALASLPTHQEAIAQLMATLQAPVTKLARTLAASYDCLVKTLAAVAKIKA